MDVSANPPPGCLDLGNGEVLCIGTAADLAAAAEWLRRNYPAGPVGERYGPVSGPVLNMKIHHTRPSISFTVIPNDALQDERLSLAARGELAYLLSRPDGWNTTADAEAKRARVLRGKRGEGRDAMRRIYAELKAAGYVRYERTRNEQNGEWTTQVHVFDRPTDVRLTGVPETRMSVPPAETSPPVDNSPASPQVTEFSQVAPMYGSPGVGSPGVGSPVHREAVHSYKGLTTEDLDQSRAGDAVDGKEQPIANSQDRRVPDGPEDVADDAQRNRDNHSESATTDRNARASEPNGLATGDDDSDHAESRAGGAGAPLSEAAKAAASDAISAPDVIAAEEHKMRELARLEAWMREQPEPADADPDFAAFWDAYPKHAGKQAAQAAWQLATGRADPASIVVAAKQYAATCRSADDRRYLKAPAAWLTDDGWLDHKPKDTPWWEA